MRGAAESSKPGVRERVLHVKDPGRRRPNLGVSHSDESASSVSAGSVGSALPGSAPPEGRPHHIIWGMVEKLEDSRSNSGDSLKLEKCDVPDNVQLLSGSDENSLAESPVAREKQPVPKKGADIGEASSEIPLRSLQCTTAKAASPVPSIGSANHAQGKCKPCMFYHSKVGCEEGATCPWCHYSHKGARRPCKSKRDRYHKRLLQSGMDPSEPT